MSLFKAFDANKILIRASSVVLAASLAFAGLTSLEVNASVRTPQASGANVTGNDKASIDASNISEGYVMVKYTGGKPGPVKLILAKNGGTQYTYNITKSNEYEVFPFTEGNGTYKLTVFENVSGTKYSAAYGTELNVTLKSEFSPFLYPNQYVNFNSSSKVVSVAQQIAGTGSDIEKVQAVYDYVVNGFTYDYEKAKSVQSSYLPVVDATLASKKGICFDYASVMVAMLRSQELPTKLVIGYAGQVYHAWISVYIQGQGWVDNIIYFDGTKWKIMDPTFASTSKPAGGTSTYVPDEATYSSQFAY